MTNPFEELVNTEPDEVDVEEVGGQFMCQTDFCYVVVDTALYIEEINTLTWKCPHEHISKIENWE